MQIRRKRGVIIAGILLVLKPALDVVNVLSNLAWLNSVKGKVPSVLGFFLTPAGLDILQIAGVCVLVGIFFVTPASREGPAVAASTGIPSALPDMVAVRPRWAIGRESQRVLVLPLRNNSLDPTAIAKSVKAHLIFSRPDGSEVVEVANGVWTGGVDFCHEDIARSETRELIIISQVSQSAVRFCAVDRQIGTDSVAFWPLGFGEWQALAVVTADRYQKEFRLALNLLESGEVKSKMGGKT